MSIEPTCLYCNAVDKSRCRTQGEANECKTYQRRQDMLTKVRTHRDQRFAFNDEDLVPAPKLPTIQEIDKALETLQKVKAYLKKG